MLIKEEKEREEKGIINITLRYGNKHVLLEDPDHPERPNSHKWTAFVGFREGNLQQNIDKIIDRVEFELHPTFRP